MELWYWNLGLSKLTYMPKLDNWNLMRAMGWSKMIFASWTSNLLTTSFILNLTCKSFFYVQQIKEVCLAPKYLVLHCFLISTTNACTKKISDILDYNCRWKYQHIVKPILDWPLIIYLMHNPHKHWALNMHNTLGIIKWSWFGLMYLGH